MTGIADEDTNLRLGKLERESANHNAKLDAIQGAVEKLSQKSDQPTNWIGIGGLIFGTFSFLFAIMTLVTGANKDLIDKINEQLNVRTSIVYEAPALIAKNFELIEDTRRWNSTHGEKLSGLLQSVAGLQAKSEWYLEWLSTTERQMDIERARNAKLEERVSRQEGLQERLTTQVDQIDSGGSRRWNDESK